MTEKMDSIKLPEDSPAPRRRRTYSRKPRLNASEQDSPRSSEQREEIQVLSGKDQQEIEVSEVKEKDDHLNQMSATEITNEVPDQTVGSSESSISHRVKAFMHPSEQEFADLLDYYHINYLYEPRSFPLRWNGNRVVEMFTPDFYLPEYDQYFELTTMKQNLVTQKNRKLRHVRELYPEVNVQLLYRRDLMRLMGKYGYGPLSETPIQGTSKILFEEEVIQNRVKEIAKEITKDYQGKDPVLVGVLRGVIVFMADLMRSIDLEVEIEFMEISHYGEEVDQGIEIIRDSLTELKDKHVIVVEDIVDTGLTLRYLVEHLNTKEPASIRICTLLDKSARRMADIPVDYIGFEIPDEFVVGYGLDNAGKYRNLPHIAILDRIEPKAVAQR